MLSPRRSVVVATAALLLASGCSSGGDGDDPTGAGTSSAPSPPPRTAPAPPVDPEVVASPQGRAIEEWAAAYARAINEGDRTFGAAADPAAPALREWMERHAVPEWGRYLPGPLPVAPLGMRPDGDSAREVQACVLVSGWSQESRSVRRTRSRDVVGMTFRVVSATGGWRVERITSAEVDCRGVVPPTRTW
ncbi:hypothetical protein [Nocardioides nitrophenolicus]|uniref:hypothetical protein n=1 Tax=Nocardioides nitrophenolicus TaxID=60489 RepID=UPI001956840C|nr:hypothetical protein [Nocardioides nitrophenolicus]MBM7517929.1 hypothetical protein [Nocardioides nitrophenolicus]